MRTKGMIVRSVFACLGLLIGCSKDQSVPPATSRTETGLIAELESLPFGLEVKHTPAKVRDSQGPNISSDWKYRWIFRTEVRATEKPLTITRFGVLAWDGTQWVLPPDQSHFNAGLLGQKEFIEWYSCPEATVEPNKPAVDPQNWAGSHTLADFKQKWFFIGVDEGGKSFKGEGLVELLAR